MPDDTAPRLDTMTPPGDLRPARLTGNARTILERRYLVKDDSGAAIESPEELFWRVASVVARVDERHGAKSAAVTETALQFYQAMATGTFMPNSPTLMNAGRPLGQLSACFVLPVEDTLSNGRSGIYDTLRAMALVHQSGGGTGFSFSRIRPAGGPVRSTTGIASGPISFMTLYDASTDVVKQGGTRRGANMAILRVDHPDIRDFIGCKEDTSKLTNFNISVAVTDAFMKAVAAGETYDLIHPVSGEPAGRESAPEVFDSIVRHAWQTGEPGVFFIDRAEAANPVPAIGQYEATNPCGEQPLLAYDVCNLGSIDLGQFVKHRATDPQDPADAIDWNGLGRAVDLAVHFLDNVIDANRYPLEEITQLAQRIRRIGLGVMGWADMLIRLGVPYDCKQAVDCGLSVMSFVTKRARAASERLASERGPFPEWPDSVWGPEASCARNADWTRIRPERRLRHCNLTTVAPTGTISIIAGCSSGIEPLFAVAFTRRQAGETMHDVNSDFVACAQREGWHSDRLMGEIAETGRIDLPGVPKSAQELFVTAHDISPEWHVRMQAAFQENVDSAVSKTTNFPCEARVEDVRAIYGLAYELGCKGITVYRDGSRPEQVLSTGKTPTGVPAAAERIRLLEEELTRSRDDLRRLEVKLAERAETVASAAPAKRSRPGVLTGKTFRIASPLGELYVTINEDDSGAPFEVFCTLGKAGGAAMADTEAIGRLISLALRSGIPLSRVRDQLRGISCDRAAGVGPNKVLSVPDGIAQALERYLESRGGPQERLPFASLAFAESAAEDAARQLTHSYLGSCPDCGSGQLAFEEGCVNCHVCGYSECS